VYTSITKKAKQFKEIDLRSVKASADAASYAGVSHFIYVSVAWHPANYAGLPEVRKKVKNIVCIKILIAHLSVHGMYWDRDIVAGVIITSLWIGRNNSFMEDKSKKCSTRNNHANVECIAICCRK